MARFGAHDPFLLFSPLLHKQDAVQRSGGGLQDEQGPPSKMSLTLTSARHIPSTYVYVYISGDGQNAPDRDGIAGSGDGSKQIRAEVQPQGKQYEQQLPGMKRARTLTKNKYVERKDACRLKTHFCAVAGTSSCYQVEGWVRFMADTISCYQVKGWMWLPACTKKCVVLGFADVVEVPRAMTACYTDTTKRNAVSSFSGHAKECGEGVRRSKGWSTDAVDDYLVTGITRGSAVMSLANKGRSIVKECSEIVSNIPAHIERWSQEGVSAVMLSTAAWYAEITGYQRSGVQGAGKHEGTGKAGVLAQAMLWA
eukprot:1157739-Pelagomonas_calceolata.AAC.5